MDVFRGWKKALVGVGLVGALTVGVGVGVNAQSGGNVGPPAPEGKAGGASPTEAVFVPITPCRIVNTATSGAGKLGPNVTRAYESQGNTSSQGGATSCGIPATASALEVNITAPLANGTGYLRVAPAGVPIPNATFMNYTPHFNVSNAGTIRITPGTGNNFQVKAFNSSTHVVVDVLGYYVTEAFAVVNANGTLARGNGVVSTANTGGDGWFEVVFDRNITGCTYVATVGNPAGGNPPIAFAETALRTGTTNGVFVQITDAAGVRADHPFHLIVDC